MYNFSPRKTYGVAGVEEVARKFSKFDEKHKLTNPTSSMNAQASNSQKTTAKITPKHRIKLLKKKAPPNPMLKSLKQAEKRHDTEKKKCNEDSSHLTGNNGNQI